MNDRCSEILAAVDAEYARRDREGLGGTPFAIGPFVEARFGVLTIRESVTVYNYVLAKAGWPVGAERATVH